MTPATQSATNAGVQRPTQIRHIVLWLTVAVYVITYMDRVVMSAAVPWIRTEFGFSLVVMSIMQGSFRWGYALFQIPGGWIGDLIGPRKALALVVTWWSIFTSATALAWNATSMLVMRFVFGMGEAGAFPIATRSISRWILPAERGYAQGITHAGSRFGAAATPPIVVWLILSYGWRTPFFVFGVIGIVWSVIWLLYYRDSPQEHRSVNDAELELIQGSLGARRAAVKRSVPWRVILSNRVVWILSAMYFCYGWALAVYLDWFPTYLNSHRGFSLKDMGIFAALPLLAGGIGAFTGGWVSDLLYKRTGNVVFSRRLVAMVGFFIAAAGILPATLTSDPLISVWYSCLAFFGLEITVGVSWAVPLDVGGDFAGSVSAVMNCCGNIGGAISSTIVGFIVQSFGWNGPFLIAAAFCVLAAGLFFKIDASRRIFTESA